MDAECFIAIEAKGGVRLELLSRNRDTRNLYAKVLNLLIQDKSRNSFVDENFLMTKYCEDLNQLRRNIFTTKEYFGITIEKLKTTFLSTTQTMFQQEKMKTKTIKKQSMKIIQQNRNNLEELLKENQELDVKNWKLEQQLKLTQDQVNFLKSSQSKESIYSATFTKLMQIIHSILGLNGDQSIENESQVGYSNQSDESKLLDCISSLERVKSLYENSQNLELSLRQDVQQQQDQIIMIKDENVQLQNIKEELECRLDEAKQQMELKEQQFEKVIHDMKEMQQVVQKVLQKKQSLPPEVEFLKNENMKLKSVLNERLSDFKRDLLIEEQEQLRLFIELVSFIVTSCIKHQKKVGDPLELIESALKKLKGRNFNCLCEVIEKKLEYYEQNNGMRDQMLNLFREQLGNYMAQQLALYNQSIQNLQFNSSSTNQSRSDQNNQETYYVPKQFDRAYQSPTTFRDNSIKKFNLATKDYLQNLLH